MGENMKNSKVIILTIFIIIGMILFPTIYKIFKSNTENKIMVIEKEFLYQAKKCYNKNDCTNKTIYLKDLYNKKYLKEKLTNPINKKYYSEDSYVNLDTLKIKLIF